MNRRHALAALGTGLAAVVAASLGRDAWPVPPANGLDLIGGRIHVVFDEADGIDRDRVLGWILLGARAIETYFGRYPAARHVIEVIAENGRKVGHATTWGGNGSSLTRIHVGRDTDEDAFLRDWVLVHEMVHASLPDLPRRALWLQEGSATWIEPVARVQAGQLPPEAIWSQAVAGMPKGQPGADAGGMDGTEAWGRLYWGGATFWLLAEIAIHEASQGTRGLREALRAIARTSGGNVVVWTPERMMREGDAAVGNGALSSLYRTFASRRVPTDLDALFARLGVEPTPHGIAFDDRAPLAALRRKIGEAGPG
ncbi:hypothetical protein [Luteibacter sp. CQ10]|uniref:hypothetical protein n=1 Tax=Luteibacter sp. CQ10 TaxID=2805821 RepID=UPI0034A57C7C